MLATEDGKGLKFHYVDTGDSTINAVKNKGADLHGCQVDLQHCFMHMLKAGFLMMWLIMSHAMRKPVFLHMRKQRCRFELPLFSLSR